MNESYWNESFFLLGARLTMGEGYAWDLWTYIWEQTAEVNLTAGVLLIEILVPFAYLVTYGNETLCEAMTFVTRHSNCIATVLELHGMILSAYCIEFSSMPKKELYQLVSDQQRKRLDFLKRNFRLYPIEISKEALNIFLEKSSFPLQGFWLYWDLANNVVCPALPNEREENTLSVLSDANMPTT